MLLLYGVFALLHFMDFLFLTFEKVFKFLIFFKNIQVQWDEPASIIRPERVSAWELEPLVAAAAPSNIQPAHRNKRARPPVLPSATPDISVLGMDALFYIFNIIFCQELIHCIFFFMVF